MSEVKPVALLKGAATFLPLVGHLACRGSGGTVSARYCYAVWLRHLILAGRAGLWPGRVETVAELGPGDSIGTGLAAILSGVDKYYAFDAKPHASWQRAEEMLDRLVELLARRAPVPDHFEFPQLQPRLPFYEFPRDILTAEILRESLHPRRVARIRACLRTGTQWESTGSAKGETAGGKAIRIVYVAPWEGSHDSLTHEVDWVFSQAVLEHVEDIGRVYRALDRWLKPGAFMSHAIDFKSHGLTRHWHGHWTVPERTWKAVRGRRPYLINRMPLSAHLREMAHAGFQIVSETTRHSQPLPRGRLVFGREWFTEEDLGISGSFVLAVKPA